MDTADQGYPGVIGATDEFVGSELVKINDDMIGKELFKPHIILAVIHLKGDSPSSLCRCLGSSVCGSALAI